jgi:hypothetical protein
MNNRRARQAKILARRAERRSRNAVKWHIRLVMRPPYYGQRCHTCRDVPPQPGEVMEEDWRKWAGFRDAIERTGNE